ncbi:MAG: hypothetical protein ABW061_04635 [Polyangiaceae bacterium]
MSALSSKARAVIEQAHEEVRPAAGERERLEALLDAQLGATAPGLVNPEPALVRQASSWRWVTSLTVGAALVGGAALWALRPNIDSRPASTALSASAQVKPPEAAPTVASLADAQASIAPESAPSAKVSPETKAALQPAQNTLAQEVALLSRATSDLRAGRAGPALKLLDEHQRKFPNGMLTVERRAVRAQALCALKRVSEGRAELARLAPQSPAAGRAKQLCDAASASGVPQ